MRTNENPIILGLGNPIFRDEGIGIHIVHQLIDENPDSRVEFIDGGTDGLMLLDTVERAEKLLVIDAVNINKEPGSVHLITGNNIPLFTQTKLSQHQLSFQEVLALAHFRDKLPRELVLIGVQPKTIELGTNLTLEVTRAIPKVITLIHDQLNKWLPSVS